jgi:regulator of sigma E protease
MIITILAFVFVFGILVFVHELGHFLAARNRGIRVDEFAFGFPPKIWSTKKGETTYAINAIPIGGYVKLFGEEGEGAKKKDSLAHKKPWEKVLVLAAGVSMNILLAWLLLTAFYIFGGRPIIPGMESYKQVSNNQIVTVAEVAAGTPAEKNGIKKGQIVVSIDGKPVHTNSDVFEQIQGAPEVDGARVVSMVVSENGKEAAKTVSTYKDEIEVAGQKKTVNRVGITMDESGSIKAIWWAAPIVAAKETFQIAKLNVVGMYGFFKALLTQGQLSKDVGGPVAIAQLSGGAARMGAMVLLQFIAVLSIAVAILNILPFPALDGGHIMFIGIEKIIRKEVPAKAKNAINWAGFGLLLLLMVVVTFNDLVRVGIIDKIKGLF